MTFGNEAKGRFDTNEDTLGDGRRTMVSKDEGELSDVATISGEGSNRQAEVEEPVLACFRQVTVN